MKRKRRHNQWRGRKWIDTRFSRNYKVQKALGVAQAVVALRMANVRVHSIAASSGVPSIAKKAAIAISVITGMKTFSQAIKKVNDDADKRWRI